jgi:hypothetical protein
MKQHALAVLICLLFYGSLASAAVSEEEFAQLRADFAALAERLDTLEAENVELRMTQQDTGQVVEQTQQQVATLNAVEQEPSWTDNIAIKGDFRYRYENIDKEGTDKQRRNRIRARAAIVANLPNDVEVGLGMASGGDDPVSTNQTLGGGGATKDLRLDLAYFDWSGIDGLHVIGGKFKNQYIRTGKNGLLWDADWNPEGFALTYSRGLFFVTGLGTWLESDSKTTNTEFSYGGQVGINGDFGGAKVTAGLGYYEVDTAGKSSFFGTGFGGNSFDPMTMTYLFDYQNVNAFVDSTFNLGELPLRVFANYVENLDPNDENVGWVLGAKLGKASDRAKWEAQYAYERLEKDAVFGLLTDSDFGGGGTDAQGHIIKAGVGINKQWALGLTYFINQQNISSGATKNDYNRLMLDTNFKYK